MSGGGSDVAGNLCDLKLLSGLQVDKLIDFFARIGISRPGLDSVRAKHVTGEMLVEFCEEDIRDVFEEFKDRFLIRKLLRDPSQYHQHLKPFISSVEVVTVPSDDSDSEQQEPVRFQSPRITSSGLQGDDLAQRSRGSSTESSVIQPIRQSNDSASPLGRGVHAAVDKALGALGSRPEASAAMQQQADWKHYSSMGESLRIPVAAMTTGLDVAKLGKQILTQSGSSMFPTLGHSQGQSGTSMYSSQGQLRPGFSTQSMSSGSTSNPYSINLSYAPVAVNPPVTLSDCHRVPSTNASKPIQTKSESMCSMLLPSCTTAALSDSAYQRSGATSGHTNMLPKPPSNSILLAQQQMAMASMSGQVGQLSQVDHQIEAAYNGYAMESLQCIQSSIARFTAEELLAKKALRGKPSDAHSASHTIIRQAAQLAGIWRKAPPVKSITMQQKEKFLESVFYAAPQLTEYRTLVWQRLIQALQNRRKYLLDRKLGKRRSTSGKVISPDGSGALPQMPSQFGLEVDSKEAVDGFTDSSLVSWGDSQVVEIDSDTSCDEYIMQIKEEVAEEFKEAST